MAVASVADISRARAVSPAVEMVVTNSPNVGDIICPGLLPATSSAGHVEGDLAPRLIECFRHLTVLGLTLEVSDRGRAPILDTHAHTGDDIIVTMRSELLAPCCTSTHNRHEQKFPHHFHEVHAPLAVCRGILLIVAERSNVAGAATVRLLGVAGLITCRSILRQTHANVIYAIIYTTPNDTPT